MALTNPPWLNYSALDVLTPGFNGAKLGLERAQQAAAAKEALDRIHLGYAQIAAENQRAAAANALQSQQISAANALRQAEMEMTQGFHQGELAARNREIDATGAFHAGELANRAAATDALTKWREQMYGIKEGQLKSRQMRDVMEAIGLANKLKSGDATFEPVVVNGENYVKVTQKDGHVSLQHTPKSRNGISDTGYALMDLRYDQALQKLMGDNPQFNLGPDAAAPKGASGPMLEQWKQAKAQADALRQKKLDWEDMYLRGQSALTAGTGTGTGAAGAAAPSVSASSALLNPHVEESDALPVQGTASTQAAPIPTPAAANPIKSIRLVSPTEVAPAALPSLVPAPATSGLSIDASTPAAYALAPRAAAPAAPDNTSILSPVTPNFRTVPLSDPRYGNPADTVKKHVTQLSDAQLLGAAQALGIDAHGKSGGEFWIATGSGFQNRSRKDLEKAVAKAMGVDLHGSAPLKDFEWPH